MKAYFSVISVSCGLSESSGISFTLYDDVPSGLFKISEMRSLSSGAEVKVKMKI
jgi:hypothetical protein